PRGQFLILALIFNIRPASSNYTRLLSAYWVCSGWLWWWNTVLRLHLHVRLGWMRLGSSRRWWYIVGWCIVVVHWGWLVVGAVRSLSVWLRSVEGEVILGSLTPSLSLLVWHKPL